MLIQQLPTRLVHVVAVTPWGGGTKDHATFEEQLDAEQHFRSAARENPKDIVTEFRLAAPKRMRSADLDLAIADLVRRGIEVAPDAECVPGPGLAPNADWRFVVVQADAAAPVEEQPGGFAYKVTDRARGRTFHAGTSEPVPVGEYDALPTLLRAAEWVS